MASSEAQSQIDAFSDFLSRLKNHTGFRGPITLKHAGAVRDVIFCLRAHHRPMPPWMTEQVWAQLVAVKRLSWRLRFRTLGLRRRQGGPLLSRLMRDFAADEAASKGRLRLYSAHDSNVAALLTSAHVFNGMHPPYASAGEMNSWLWLSLIRDSCFLKCFFRVF